MLELELLRSLRLRHVICLPEGNKQREDTSRSLGCYTTLYLRALKYRKEGGGLKQEGGAG